MRFFLFFFFSFFLFILPFNSQAQFTPPESESLEVIEEEQLLITNVFYETDVREALAAISAQSGINIIPDQTAYGFISMELIDVPFEEALRRILSPLGFTFRKMVGYYLVGAAYPDNPSFPLLSSTELVVPNYIKAVNVSKLLSSFYEPFIKVDADNNTLTITASPEMIERIKQDLAEIDVPPRQVMIQAVVTEFSKEARKSLGLDAAWLGTRGDNRGSVIFPVGNLLDSTLSIWYSRPKDFGKWKGNLEVSLRALVQDGEVRIRANPRVATIEGQKATILIGKDEYYVIVTGIAPYYYGQLERIPVGISLSLVPYISDKDEITVEIQPEVSDVVGKGVTGLPVVSRRTVSTKIRVKDGETIVIGGLLQKSESEVRRKVPLLGHIPILGFFFSRTDKVVEETETVIFITPHILRETSGIDIQEDTTLGK